MQKYDCCQGDENLGHDMEAHKATRFPPRHGSYTCCGMRPPNHAPLCPNRCEPNISAPLVFGNDTASAPAAERDASTILSECTTILDERGKHYTKGKERNWPKITEVFNVLTGRDLSCKEVLMLMVAMKLVRAVGDPVENADHYVDGINYLALVGEEALRGKK